MPLSWRVPKLSLFAPGRRVGGEIFVIEGHGTLFGPISFHDPYIHRALIGRVVGRPGEGNPPAIRRPGWLGIPGDAVTDILFGRAVRFHDQDVRFSVVAT